MLIIFVPAGDSIFIVIPNVPTIITGGGVRGRITDINRHGAGIFG